MKIEQQVTSLEISKKLKELGVKQESYFHWYQGIQGIWSLGDTTDMMNGAVDVGRSTAPQFNSYSAFTVAELGEMLPSDFRFTTEIGNWVGGHVRIGSFDIVDLFFADTEADARGKILIYLLENNLITNK